MMPSRAAPLFLVLGNHHGEKGGHGLTATRMRTTYLPNPVPDGFYTGNEEVVAPIAYLGDYCAREL